MGKSVEILLLNIVLEKTISFCRGSRLTTLGVLDLLLMA
jgi:hypothetical protein